MVLICLWLAICVRTCLNRAPTQAARIVPELHLFRSKKKEKKKKRKPLRSAGRFIPPLPSGLPHRRLRQPPPASALALAPTAGDLVYLPSPLPSSPLLIRREEKRREKGGRATMPDAPTTGRRPQHVIVIVIVENSSSTSLPDSCAALGARQTLAAARSASCCCQSLPGTSSSATRTRTDRSNPWISSIPFMLAGE
ncbi:uncharacterized protein LOC123452818 [Hordeum vulgare subsp. vulgare]|uniref:uncharacterized protein LOC123452818 n=1 Tax=Hordeum vulgare subsp. vulgare TaxID=112509 RepID=UPI001D1A3773|nr:uncharacterized protein LOC123452818 [Hordeum vulgare subsp. vulgare]